MQKKKRRQKQKVIYSLKINKKERKEKPVEEIKELIGKNIKRKKI